MYRVEEIPAPATFPESTLSLPVDVLLALPDPEEARFNLIGAMGTLLGRFGWTRATKIIAPRLWTPSWSDDALESFFRAPFQGEAHDFPTEDLRALEAVDFMGLDAQLLSDPDAQEDALDALQNDYEPRVDRIDLNVQGRESPIYRRRYDVVHLFSRIGEEDTLLLGRGQHLRIEVLQELLRWTGTRLLILHLPSADHSKGEAAARTFVEEGLPAALVASADDPAAVDTYYLDFYAGIVHNQYLLSVTEPPGAVDDGIDAVLLHAPGAGSVLQFHAWLEQLRARYEQLREEAHLKRDDLEKMRTHARDLLSQEGVEQLEAFLNEAPLDLDHFHDQIDEHADLLHGSLDWAHEGGGAEPLSRMGEVVSDLEADAAALDDLRATVERTLDVEAAPPSGGAAPPEASAPPEAAPPAPPRTSAPPPAAAPPREAGTPSEPSRQHRVLNSFFADAATGAALEARTSLQAGHDYALLVDIGPLRIESIVTGSKVWPEEHLPKQESYDLDVVFVSEDLEPDAMTGRMRVPAKRGRSTPYVDGKLVKAPGALALSFTAPPVADGASERRIHGRLCLYFENNLLQSAAVSTTVTREVVTDIETPSEFHVDFRLSSSLRDVSDRYARRAVRFTDDDSASHAVALNIALNNAGGRHRVLVKNGSDLAPAWSPYDPEDTREDLERAREKLIACFDGLDEDNGKTRDAFSQDLYRLALIGNDLFNKFRMQVQPEDESLGRAWMLRLRQVLARGTVIQAARAGSTPFHHIVPWGLFYDYLLEGSGDLRWCDVISEEWNTKGRRDRPLGSSCPYQDEAWHQKQILCPYGFWGLKHIVEQPLSSLRATNGRAAEQELVDAVREITVQGDIKLAIGQTTDPQLDQHALEQHLDRMSTLERIQLSQPDPNPATDSPALEKLLEDTAFVYFLCHGEYDEAKGEPYIGVGLRDGQLQHKIYSGTIMSWAETGLMSWLKQRPLVFINGCHTSDLKPGEVFNLVSAFSYVGAGGVLGTEVSVKLPLATELAEDIAAQMADGEPLGQALRRVRWKLANKGNLLGLAYTAYGLADLHFAQS